MGQVEGHCGEGAGGRGEGGVRENVGESRIAQCFRDELAEEMCFESSACRTYLVACDV